MFCSSYEETCDSENTDTMTDTELDSDEGENDLNELYTSFEYAESDTESPTEARKAEQVISTVGGSDTPLYPNPQLTASQSCLLISQYSLRHGQYKEGTDQSFYSPCLYTFL